MKELLEKLLEQREAAVKSFEDFASPILAENRELKEDEEKKYGKLDGAVKRLDKHIDEVRKTLRREEKLAEARAEIRTSTVTVTNEPKTYGENSPNSYVADLVRSSSPVWPGHQDALQRLARHSHELAVDSQSNSTERARVTRALRERNRTENGVEARKSVQTLLETRAGMDTTSASGGSFVTPVYFVQDYAPFRQFGRVFCDQANKQPLPEYGMTVYIPAVQAAAGEAVQSTQGSGVQETDPTAGYLSANLSTTAGQVTISQQLLDRAGPNFQFDKMVFDQLQRAYNFTFNQGVVTAALTGAGTPTIPTTALTISQFYSDVAAAKAAVATASGVVLPATHLFAPQATWEWLASRTDSNGHTLIVPNANGPFNAIAAGEGASIMEGDTGYKVLGLNVYEDGGIPLSSGDAQVVVAHMPEVWVFEGDLVPRVIPQTFAQNLQVLLQLYAYSTVIVRYPHAVQTLTGAAYPASPTF